MEKLATLLRSPENLKALAVGFMRTNLDYSDVFKNIGL